MICYLKKACEDVTQITKLFAEGPEKWNWLMANLVELTSSKKPKFISI